MRMSDLSRKGLLALLSLLRIEPLKFATRSGGACPSTFRVLTLGFSFTLFL
jgi:hypothetical protein